MGSEFLKEIMGWVSLAAIVGGTIPYIVSIFKGATRPNFFSWTIWAILTGIAFFTQAAAGAGLGAWTMALSALGSLIIAVIAIFKGDKHTTRGDKLTFIAALTAIPIWLLSSNPLWAVILITAIDACGFYPTFRKSWQHPFEEYLPNYALQSMAFGLSLFAMDQVTAVTVLYPLALTVMNGGVVIVSVMQRRKSR